MANYPSSASSDTNLYLQVNNKTTNLTANISNSDTTIPVTSTTGFPASGTVTVDLEIIAYSSLDATNFLGATRGFDGTSAVSHLSGALASHNIIAKHHNNMKDEVIAIETDLVGVNSALTPTAPASTSTSILNRFNQIAQRFKDLTGLTNWYDSFTFFPISKGGTNSGTALNNNRVMTSSGGAIVEASAITASRALESNGSGIPVASATTATELGYVSGVTSSIQTQINAKVSNPLIANLAAGGFKLTGLAAGTANGDSVRYEQVFGFRILQITAVTQTTQTTTTSSTFVATSLSTSITPSSTTSKIAIFVTGSSGVPNDAGGVYVATTLFRDSTNLGNSEGMVQHNNISGTGTTFNTPTSLVWIDSPASVSSITYSVRIKNNNGTSTVRWNNATALTSMYLVEIG